MTHYKPGLLHYAVISDIHLGHRNTPTQYVVDNLKLAFPRNAETAALDIIFVAGDVFEDALQLGDEDTGWALRWINYMLTLCREYDIWLIVLEGTPSHDWKQSQRFVTSNEVNQIGCKLKYIDKLTIDYMPEFDLNILYVPDELPGGPEKTLQDVKDMMRSKGITSIDHAIMHGQFDFQLPAHVNAPKHNSQAYLELVTGNISIGHDHTYKELGRIHAQGSFDRLGHGYEAPKGHMRFLQNSDGTWEKTFVENTTAMQYITIDVTDLALEASLDKIENRIKTLPEYSFVRIRGQSGHAIFANLDVLVRMNPTHTWTKIVDSTKEELESIPVLGEDIKYVPITITKDNLMELLLDRIVHNGATGAVMDAAEELLIELFQ